MQTKNRISLTRKTLYGIMLFGLFFSTFGTGNLSSARAQEIVTNTPTPEIQVQESATPTEVVTQETATPEPVVQAQETSTPTPEIQEAITPTPEVERQSVEGIQTPPSEYPRQAIPNNYHSSIQAASDASAQALTLGAPGLSFRYAQSFGVAEIPYFSDTTHLNRPEGLFMGAGDNLYVAEQQGARILKYNSSRTNTLAIGKAGVQYTDDYVFQNPADVTLDSGGNIWVADYSRVVQYDSGGNILQSLPAQNDNPWQTGNDNGRFDNVRGIAFGADGRMYVSDSNNHRVQVYTFSAGSPVYSATIGTTSVSGSDNTHFNSPYRIAMYGSTDLYVVDYGNNRVQHCVDSGTWSCTTFDSGLNNPQGITVSGSNVYVADTENGRIRKCTTTNGSCNDFVTNTWWSYDLAVDSSGNVYGATSWGAMVIKYNSLGNNIGVYVGVQYVPYLTDNYHYNHPRVAIDNSNNIIILEENGQRLIKLNSSGVAQWSVGVAGVDDPSDNAHFIWPRGVAVDTAGNIYVADNNRVQIFNGNGTYLYTIGGSWGSGNYQFGWASGIAVDNIGTIYVSDCNNNRVQVYNSSRTYVTTLGVTGIPGSDNGHLNCPVGVGVDSARNIYVADAGNNRVQKFNSSLVWQMTLGTPGPWGSGSEDFAYFGSGPEDIVVDAQGRIYVADINNNRVQVFDSSGAYLTSIGDNWGSTSSSQFRGTSGVDLDSQGNVYVSDTNGRIQKFSPGVPGWQQKNINGFGDHNNYTVNRMSVYNGYLYAGTGNDITGGEVWRSADGSNWSQVNLDGFGDATNTYAHVSESFNGNLYVGTSNSTNGGEIWRCALCDGSDWTKVVSGGFGASTNNGVDRVVVFSNTLYATTNNDTTGVQVWKSSTGNSGSWAQSNTNGFGDTNNTYLWSVAVFNNYLYAATAQWGVPFNTNIYTGVEVWRTNNGITWSQVNTDGFGNPNNMGHWLESFNGYLYAQTWNAGSGGGQIWRCATCDGTDWSQVNSNGFGDSNNIGGSFMLGFGGRLYASTYNDITGTEIWQTTNGTNWSQLNIDGYGNSNNNGVESGVAFKGSLFFGTNNWANGGQIWNIAIPPAAATLAAPIGNINTNYNPTYQWNKVDAASYYRLYVSGVLDQWFESSSICDTTTCSVTPGPSVTLGGGNFSWSVQTYNSVGYGPWSSAANFSTTILTAPAAAVLTAPIGNISTNYNPTYTWNKVPTATYYHLYVGGPSGTVLDQWYPSASICPMSTCSVASPALGGGNYSIYVQTYNPVGFGPWSAVANFSTSIPSAPGMATNLSPNTAIGTNYNPNYSWNKVAAATWYHLYVSGPSGVVLDQWYQDSVICSGGVTCTVASPTLGGGNFSIYVQTYNSAGYGPWSAVANFSTSIPSAPGMATNLLPNTAIGTNYNPNYSWNKVAAATWYHLYVSGSSGVVLDQWYQDSVICSGGVTCTVASPTLGGGNFSIYVQTYNSAGYGPWSVVANFSTTFPSAPGMATNLLPNTAIGTNYNPNYSWNKVAAATWYHLYVSGPSGAVLDQWYQDSVICSGGVTCTVASPTLGGGNYSIYVQTYNSAGYGPWSAVANFSTTFPSIPAGAVLTAPSGTTASHTPTYQWNKVDMATWYHLYVKGPSGMVTDQWVQAVNVCNSTTCSVLSPNLESGDHIWWIQTYNAAGYGPWKSATFTVSP